jgi:hypothetical protein
MQLIVEDNGAACACRCVPVGAAIIARSKATRPQASRRGARQGAQANGTDPEKRAARVSPRSDGQGSDRGEPVPVGRGSCCVIASAVAEVLVTIVRTEASVAASKQVFH